MITAKVKLFETQNPDFFRLRTRLGLFSQTALSLILYRLNGCLLVSIGFYFVRKINFFVRKYR